MCVEISETGLPEFIAAFAKAQAEMGDVIKGTENAAFKNGAKVSKYADLAAVIEAVRPALSKNGLALIQSPHFDGEIVEVETIIAHVNGGMVRSKFKAKPSKFDVQGIGSVTTYLRRYSLMSMCGVAPADDDDGNAASGAGSNGQKFHAAPARIVDDRGLAKPTLAQRAAAYERSLNACASMPEFEKVHAKGAELRAELDQKDPEMLAMLEGLETRLSASLPMREPTKTEAAEVFA
jgi:hypothetical protein